MLKEINKKFRRSEAESSKSWESRALYVEDKNDIYLESVDKITIIEVDLGNLVGDVKISAECGMHILQTLKITFNRRIKKIVLNFVCKGTIIIDGCLENLEIVEQPHTFLMERREFLKTFTIRGCRQWKSEMFLTNLFPNLKTVTVIK